jgi:hypothetical protein
MEIKAVKCPHCGCELSSEAFRYRCWCCNKSYSYSEIMSPSVSEQEALSVQSASRHDEQHALSHS